MGEAKRLGEIVYRDPAELVPYDRNARKHSPRQVKQLRAAIDEFGFTQPILCREKITRKGNVRTVLLFIGAGHGRQLAALLEPALPTVPTITVRGLTDQQWRGLILADNKLALNAEWDTNMLAAELHDLGVQGFELAVIGFSDGELADLNEIPPPPGSGSGTPSNPENSVTCPNCQHKFLPEQE